MANQYRNIKCFYATLSFGLTDNIVAYTTALDFKLK